MTRAEMERDLCDARALLAATDISAQRCYHETVTETALWLFDPAGAQIGAIVRCGGYWRASAMLRGMPISARTFPELRDCVRHVMDHRPRA